MARLKAKIPPPIQPTVQKISRRKQIANVIEMSRSKSDPTNEIDELDPPEFHSDCEICQEFVKDFKIKN